MDMSRLLSTTKLAAIGRDRGPDSRPVAPASRAAQCQVSALVPDDTGSLLSRRAPPDRPPPERPESAPDRRRLALAERRHAGARASAGTDPNAWIYGAHAVQAALANPERRCRRLLMVAEARAAAGIGHARIAPEIVARAELDRMLPPGAVHQGVALLADPLFEPALDEIIDTAAPAAFVLVLDQVSDPHNVGAILRSAAAFGASAVILNERNTPPLTGALAKAASGAIERVPLVRVVNLARGLRQLKEAGFWCIGLDGEAETSLARAIAPGRIALVLGAEGDGLRRLTAETCDTLARLPTQADFGSLNVSNAAACALYAVIAAREAAA